MTKQVISTDKAPAAIGPYSQGIKVNGFIYFSGQIPIDPASGEVVAGGIAEQTDQVMKNIGAVLKASGIGFDNVIKTTIFLTNMADFAVVNGIYGACFTGVFPARSTVEVKGLPKGVDVEIEVIAAAQ